MEALKSFENLSESDKIIFFRSLLSSTNGAVINQDETPNNSNSERSNVKVFLERLKEASGDSQAENSKKKQKTLDSWLIKRDNSSSPQKEVGQSSSQNTVQSCVLSHSNNASEISSHSEHIVARDGDDANSVDSVSNETSDGDGKAVDKSEVNKNVPMKSVLTVSPRTAEKCKLKNEKYNLRSKRKNSELSPLPEDDGRDIKRFKNTDNQHDIPSISDPGKIADNLLTNLDGSSDRLSFEENDNCNRGNLEKEKCNLRSKRKKNSKLQQSVKINNNSAEQSESNSQITDIITKSNEPSLNITSSQSNYEAYCLLSKEFSEAGLNIMDILQHEKIQTVLNDHKSLSHDAVVFIGSVETKSKQMLPVVHLAHSKKTLQEKLSDL